MSEFSLDTESWALSNLPYFRKMGFFADLTTATDEEVLREIQDRYVDAEGFPYVRQGKTPPPWTISLAPPLSDLCLLQYDYSRCWWEDTECVHPPEVEAYLGAFNKWAHISRGAFAPSVIEETWSGDEDNPSNVTVRIKLPHGTLTLTPVVRNDWFDLSTIGPINQCIRTSGIQFCLYEQFDQTAFVVALTQDEKRLLEKDRNWRFAN